MASKQKQTGCTQCGTGWIPAAVPQLKFLQNFHPRKSTFHGQLREGVKTLYMNLITKHHQDVSSFTNCHQPNQEPLEYREKRDVVSFLLRAFTSEGFSCGCQTLLNAVCAAWRGEQGRGAWNSPTSLSCCQRCVWFGLVLWLENPKLLAGNNRLIT